MNKIVFYIVATFFAFATAYAQTEPDQTPTIEESIKVIQSEQVRLGKKLRQTATASSNIQKDIHVLEHNDEVQGARLDSLSTICDSLKQAYAESRSSINGKIQETNSVLTSTRSDIRNQSLWGGLAALLILTIISLVAYYLSKRIKRGDSTIDDVRKAQDALLEAQRRLQEESVRLDNQLLEIVQQQLKGMPTAGETTGTPDHSLVVKLADEIARIETNLSKMEKSVRGYKQLVQAKDRMINNVRANGYEIISLLGQEYNDGMQFQTRFVPDDTLPEGKRIITGMIKMQVNYNGKMIQPAEIVVSQNI